MAAAFARSSFAVEYRGVRKLIATIAITTTAHLKLRLFNSDRGARLRQKSVAMRHAHARRARKAIGRRVRGSGRDAVVEGYVRASLLDLAHLKP